MFDYTASSDYETGYIDRHLRNEELRRKIDELFRDKNDCGIYIEQKFGSCSSLRNEGETVAPDYIDNLIFSDAAKFFDRLSVPVNYTNNGAQKSMTLTYYMLKPVA